MKRPNEVLVDGFFRALEVLISLGLSVLMVWSYCTNDMKILLACIQLAFVFGAWVFVLFLLRRFGSGGSDDRPGGPALPPYTPPTPSVERELEEAGRR